MSIPATIMLLLTRVDCHDGVASYLESLVTGLSQAGDRVVHASLGAGIVESVNSLDGDLAVLLTRSGKVYPMNSRYLSTRGQ